RPHRLPSLGSADGIEIEIELDLPARVDVREFELRALIGLVIYDEEFAVVLVHAVYPAAELRLFSARVHGERGDLRSAVVLLDVDGLELRPFRLSAEDGTHPDRLLSDPPEHALHPGL